MSRRFLLRLPSPTRLRARTLGALALGVLALAGCAPESIVPAPVMMPQSPYGAEAPPESAFPPAPVSAAPLPPTAPGTAGPAAGGPTKVALLVPLSGPNAPLGQAILQAAQLALFATGGAQLTLVPRDTGGTAAGAASAARSAVAEGVSLILGPLLAGEVEAVKPIAGAAHINVIAFSTATQLAGDHTYLMGFLPRQEIVREVDYAHGRGLSRFAALAPNSAYGHLVVDAMRQEAASDGASVTKTVFYDPRGDSASAIGQLFPAGAAGAPAPGLPAPGLPAPAAPGAPAVDPAAASGPPAFDALLLPEGGTRLIALARRLKAAGFDPNTVRLLGSGLWDDSSIGAETSLVGGWFAASAPGPRADFDSRYAATYGHKPPLLASLGFDAAALAAVLERNGGSNPFSQQAIQNPSGFTGVDGLFRFGPNGLVERGLAVLEVQPQGEIVVSPAPQSFQNLGY